jgi:hypothetical protein
MVREEMGILVDPMKFSPLFIQLFFWTAGSEKITLVS